MQPGYPQPYGVPVLPDQNGGLAIAGLVLGCVSLVLCIFNICDTPFIALGIIFSALGMKSMQRKTLAIVGLVLSLIALVLATGIFILEMAANGG
jgi:hypothetical protein